MRLSVQISLFLVVLCVSGAFSSPNVDRNAAWDACYNTCGKPFGGDGMSDDDKLACIKGCCSVARSLNVRSEMRQDEESEIDPIDVFEQNYPKTFAWMKCVDSYGFPRTAEWYKGVSECCHKAPLA